MKKTLIILIGLAWACNSSQKTVNSPAVEDTPPKITSETYAETITENELKEHLYIYASDEFEGRETGQPGQKKAVAYLKAEYEKLGIEAAKTNGDYFQNVPLEMSKLPVGKLIVNDQDFLVGERVLTFNSANSIFDEVVYVGYG
ncbi:MAG: peptidase, partial [Maribacter sp.]